MTRLIVHVRVDSDASVAKALSRALPGTSGLPLQALPAPKGADRSLWRSKQGLYKDCPFFPAVLFFRFRPPGAHQRVPLDE